MEIHIDPRLPETGKMLLLKLERKEITLIEFLTECAYWVLKDGFDELIPKQLPYKPQEVIELDNKTPAQRATMNWNAILLDHPRIKQYYDTCHYSKIANWSNFMWLKEILSYIPIEDTLSREQIKNRISEFKTFKMTGSMKDWEDRFYETK